MDKRALLQKLFDTAVAEAHPSHCLMPHLPAFPKTGRLLVVGAGKAAAAMAQVVEEYYADHLQPGNSDRERFSGLVIAPSGSSGQTLLIEIAEGSHPIPDERSVQATERLLAKVRHLGENDQVLVLLSGGASALLCLPAKGVTLADKQALTQQLLSAGASIQDINQLRQGLSAIKGGKLGQACYPARIKTVAISDVVGDNPALIGSGPTVASPVIPHRMAQIINKYQLSLSSSVKALLLDEYLESDTGMLPRTSFQIVSCPMDALQAAAKVADEAGYQPTIISDAIEGEAQQIAQEMRALILAAAKTGQKQALLSGGEVTVTLDQYSHYGEHPEGGPNREFALALALALEGHPAVKALVADTDGVDGKSDPEQPVAGAVIDATTLERARNLGLDARGCLTNHQSGKFFQVLGDEVISGATETNVNDFRVILIN